MPRERRIDAPGCARLLTFSCHRRLPLFATPRIRDRFVERLAEARSSLGFQLFAYVVMPEHVHLLLLPRGDAGEIGRILNRVKRPFAQEVLRGWRETDKAVLARVVVSGGGHRFWMRGGGHDRVLYSREAAIEAARYIHENPVRRGLVERETDWAWSSARWWVERRGLFPMDPV